MLVTVPPLRSISLAVTDRLFKATVAPTGPPNTTLPLVTLAVRVSARGVLAESLLTVAAKVITAPVSVADKVVGAPSVTASLKVWEPTVEMPPPLIAVVPPTSVVKLLSLSPAALVPPIAPPKMVAPLSLIAKLRLPPLDLTVLPRVMPTPVSVVSAPSVTASLKVCAPVVMMLPPLTAVVPAASVVMLLSFSSAVALPTAPSRVVVPLSLIVKLRLLAPLDNTVLARVTPTPVSVVFAPRVTASLKVCAPVVVMLPPLNAVVPSASVVRLLSFSPAVALPIASVNVVVPLSLIVRLRLTPSDLIVPVTLMPTPVSVVLAPRVTGPV